MNGPSVTPVDRTVFAVCGPWSWCPLSSLPVAPHFSYQAPTSANQAFHSGVPCDGSFGVSMISITYFTRFSLSSGTVPPARHPLTALHEREPAGSDSRRHVFVRKSPQIPCGGI